MLSNDVAIGNQSQAIRSYPDRNELTYPNSGGHCNDCDPVEPGRYWKRVTSVPHNHQTEPLLGATKVALLCLSPNRQPVYTQLAQLNNDWPGSKTDG
jgi:hypothetical protein